MMAMVVLSSFGLGRVLRSVTGRIEGALLAAVFMGLALFEFLVSTPTKMSIQVDPFYYRIAADPGDFAVLDLSFEKNAILAQTVHGRKITAGALIVPRSASVRSKLQVERDVLDPVPVLTLPPDERAARLSWDGAEIRQHRIRYLVYPGGSRGPRLLLAKLLGAETVASPPLVFCTFESVR